MKYEVTIHWKFGRNEKTKVYQFPTWHDAHVFSFTKMAKLFKRVQTKYGDNFWLETQPNPYVKIVFNNGNDSVTFYEIHTI